MSVHTRRTCGWHPAPLLLHLAAIVRGGPAHLRDIGTVESLNLAVAAAVMLYEVRRGQVGAAS